MRKFGFDGTDQYRYEDILMGAANIFTIGMGVAIQRQGKLVNIIKVLK